ncbi:hypothetical protein [Thalassolituus sp.]|uniref:hypothetical protein n=1 Tax=Thalassolituus sp. TaxID=2030822 RepID=UPI00261E0379|nr:hypothetical protein [Thalassolituus sp.]
MRHTTDAQQEKRDAIQRQIDEFTANGGQIQQLPYSPDEYPAGELGAVARKKEKSRKRGQAAPGWKGQSPMQLSVNGHKNRIKSGYKGHAA